MYVLYGSWDGEVERALRDNFSNMADRASRTEAAVITGTVGDHFQNEVFSWHQLNGEQAEPLLPALLITTVHPALFKNSDDPYWHNHTVEDVMVLVPFGKRSQREAVDLIREVFNDIQDGRALNDFGVSKKLRRGRGRAFMDGLILQPNFMGVGFDFKAVPDIIRGR